MRKLTCQLATAILLLLCFSSSSTAQEEPSMEEFMAVFTMQFDLLPPDTSFEKTPEGTWEQKATQSKIAVTALPASFERVMQDSSSFDSNEGMKILSRGFVENGGVRGYLIQAEFTPPAGEKNQEPFHALMLMRPLTEKITMNLNAVYPKSQHERLYKKMLASFATARQKE